MPRSAKKAEASGVAENTLRLLGERAAQAVGVLTALMQDEGQKPELRMKAAESILDRVCGKAGGGVSVPAAESEPCVRFEGVLEEWSR